MTGLLASLARIHVVAAVVVAASLAGGPTDAAADAPPPRPALEASGWIGIAMDRGSELGVRVEHVVRTGPASTAGVRAGDRITAVDGVDVQRPDALAARVSAHRPGEAVALTVERSGASLVVKVVAAGRPSAEEIARMELVGAPLPPWAASTTPIGAAPRTPAELRGRVVVLDFWASWCGPCRAMAPRLTTLQKRYGAQGLRVVGITTDAPDEATRAMERHKMGYPSLSDEHGETNRAYGIGSLPTLVVVDKRGVVRDVRVGFDPTGDAALEARVRALLAEPVTQGP